MKYTNKQLTKKEAIAFAESGKWKKWTDEEVLNFQIYQRKLCMDFGRFKEAMGNVLKRPVYTHEFSSSNFDNLIKEYLKIKSKPELKEIIDLIPKEKLILINH
jgi:hypothetical protein